MMIILIIIMMMSSVFSVLAGGALFFTPQEGDECEGKDDNGNYVIDEDGKCVLDECDTGYYESNGKCKEDKSAESCEPTGTKDPQGIYLTDQMGLCELTGCNTGYNRVGDTCIVSGNGAASTIAAGGNGAASTIAAGGDYIYEHEGYTVHVFNTSGDFVVEEIASGTEVECLIVAGGGGGGSADDVNGGGGGGGGGGVLYKTVIVSQDTYPIVVVMVGKDFLIITVVQPRMVKIRQRLNLQLSVVVVAVEVVVQVAVDSVALGVRELLIKVTVVELV